MNIRQILIKDKCQYLVSVVKDQNHTAPLLSHAVTMDTHTHTVVSCDSIPHTHTHTTLLQIDPHLLPYRMFPATSQSCLSNSKVTVPQLFRKRRPDNL